jgi:hypothetical protein
MTRPDLRAAATRRLEEALRERGARDPRDYYRELMKELRERDPAAFGEANRYYDEVLLPRLADDSLDPLGEWLEYGTVLAGLMVAGEAVQIDPSGRSLPYAGPVPPDAMVLHLPRSSRMPALAIGLPPTLSAPQRATYDLLVSRKLD